MPTGVQPLTFNTSVPLWQLPGAIEAVGGVSSGVAETPDAVGVFHRAED
jgi:hypothetical protein